MPVRVRIDAQRPIQEGMDFGQPGGYHPPRLDDDVQYHRQNNIKHCTHQHGEESFRIIQVQTLADGDKTGSQRPEYANHPTHTWDDG